MHKIAGILFILVLLTGTLTFGPQSLSGAESPGLPPHIIELSPFPGTEMIEREPLTITFDQAMDRASVETAIQFDPALTGDFRWIDYRTVQFMPAERWQADITYNLTITTTALAANGLPLEYPYHVEIQTIRPLAVGDVSPLPDSEDVAVDSQIVIAFNRPVVPLTATDKFSEFATPITITPATEGTGQWVNSALYAFTPTTSLRGGTQYTVTAATGLTSVDGASLPEDFVWRFQTIGPRVTNFYPLYGYDQLKLDRPIVVKFSQAMDEASTEAAFRLFTDDEQQTPVSGTFSWNDTHTSLTFQPDERLRIGTYYRVALDSAALNASHDSGLLEPFSERFYTVPWPGINTPIPARKQRNGITIEFVSAMNMNSLRDRVRIEPEPDEWWPEVISDNYIHFAFAPLPDTEYTLTVLAGAEDIYGNPITEDYTLTVTFDQPTRTSNYARTYDNSWGSLVLDASLPDTSFEVTIRGQVESKFDLYRLEPPYFSQSEESYTYPNEELPVPSTGTLVRAWEQTLTAKPLGNERVPILLASETGGQLPLGLYQLSYGFLDDYPDPTTWEYDTFKFVVANVNLTLKSTPDELFIWVTDLLTGEPRANVPVTIYTYGETLGSEVSDENGVVRVPLAGRIIYEAPSINTGWNEHWLWVVAEDEDDFGYWSAHATWNRPVDSLFLYTDRGIYRPGETVYFRGVLRQREDMDYSIPPLASLQVTSNIFSAKEGGGGEHVVLFDEDMTVSPFGTFSGEFTIPDDAPLGRASLYTNFDEPGEFWGTEIYFTVADYRVPEYHVSVTPDKTEVIQGDTIQAMVEAAYYAGGPVTDAPMFWKGVSNPAYFPCQGRGHYHFYDYDIRPIGYRYGEYYLGEDPLFTDIQGQHHIEFELEEQTDPYPVVIDLQATVSDESGQQIAARNTVLVHPAEVYVGLRADTYFGRENEPITIEAIAVTPQSDIIPNQSLTISAIEIQWERHPIPDEWGRYTWEHTETTIASEVIETDADGMVYYTFTPPHAGIYKILAETVDAAGRPNRSAVRVWIRGKNRLLWGATKNHEVTMIPDQDSYRPGDTAQVLIPIPFIDEGQTTVLITVERSGIFTYDVQQVEGPAESILYEVSLTTDHAPNVFVNVLMIQSATDDDPFPDYRQGQIRLDVEPVDRLLAITLTPNQTTYHPRDEAVFDVRVTDWEGNPVPEAEVGLNLTDKAVLDLTPTYSDRYGAGCSTPPRFAPLGEPVSPIIAAFYSPQRNRVYTNFSLHALVGIDRSEGNPGGGCGGGGGPSFADPVIRTDFETTPLWEAHLVTDEAGHTQARVTLPDNLTTWELKAVALTADTDVGQAKIELVSALPLRVRPITPRFFVAGDQVDLGAIVHNATDTSQTVDVYLEAEGVTITADNPQTITIAPESRVAVSWRVQVDDVPGVDLTFSASSANGLSDATKPMLTTGPDGTIPVYRYTATDTVGTAGLLTDAESRLEGISLPPRFDPAQSELALTLSPSLVEPLMDSLTYLETYLHYCIEQTVSRFLPNVVTYRMLRTAGITDDELQTNLTHQITEAMGRLKTAQNADGGWGWFSDMASDALVTTYVVLGLYEVQDAGFPVDEALYTSGLKYVRASAAEPLPENRRQWWLGRRAFQACLLARTGQSDPAQLMTLFEHRAYLSAEGYAYLLLAYAEDFPAAPEAEVLLSDLLGGAIFSATGVHWEEDTWRNWGSDTRTTALVLSALVRYDPDHDLLPNIVRWLLIARQGDHWVSTQETTWAIIGLTDWIVHTGELHGDYAYQVDLNDEQIASHTVTPATALESVNLSVAAQNMLVDELNRLQISRSEGEGVLYYSAFLNLIRPVVDVQAINRGVSISREYFRVDDLETPVTEARVGDTVAVRLTITTTQDLYFAVIEDPLPAGLETLNRQLAITPDITQPMEHYDPAWRWGWWWFDQIEIRDEQTNLYADFLPRGTYVYTYYAQVAFSGEFQVIPARGYAFYQPDIFGRTAGMVFRIEPGE